MKKKNLVRLGLVIVLLVAALFVLPSFTKSEEKPCCKDNMKECPRKKATDKTPGLIWDDFSRQFFSFAAISY